MASLILQSAIKAAEQPAINVPIPNLPDELNELLIRIRRCVVHNRLNFCETLTYEDGELRKYIVTHRGLGQQDDWAISLLRRRQPPVNIPEDAQMDIVRGRTHWLNLHAGQRF